ncbi:multidrug/biocide efflux PACE transporter [uncultured Castellaniella sp.]|uniref:multidrug/biocide efflux PACE transporter n=1 Tax=uncultured Castellaniella sp. TaxID=647907 RepID=UPI00261A6E31|nr:multidrug/biocide efflux PACE transporter [uncultured Castellaniella sp.]
MQIHHRSLSERIFHALAFEVLAIGISAPLAAWITGHSALDMGVMTAAIATIAVTWNMIYNWLFDRLQSRLGFDRTYWVRVGHACGFEGGLIIIAIPFVAWWLGISMWQALLLDIGFVLFYLPYGFLFNLGYDKIRQNLIATH